MQIFAASFESHGHGGTLYLTGMLTELAATRAGELIAGTHPRTSVIRVDMRGIHMIDPVAFTAVARALNRWRDRAGGRVYIQFPEGSFRKRPARTFRIFDGRAADPCNALQGSITPR